MRCRALPALQSTAETAMALMGETPVLWAISQTVMNPARQIISRLPRRDYNCELHVLWQGEGGETPESMSGPRRPVRGGVQSGRD